MSTRTAKQTDALIRKELPGYKLSPDSSMIKKGRSSGADAPGSSRSRRRVDAATPSIEDLRRKFLGSDAGGPAPAIEADEGQDADIVLVEPADEAAPGRRRRKAVVISATGKVLGAQG